MKKLFLMLVAVLVSSVAIAKDEVGVNWFHGTLEQAIEKASAEDKLVFVDCFVDWCGPCKRMKANEFTKEEAGNYFNKNYVCIAIDMEKGEGLDVAKKYSIRSYPTFLILDAQGEHLGTVVGGAEMSAFIKKVEKAKVKKVKNKKDKNKK